MIDENLDPFNMKKETLLKNDIIIEYDDKRSDYADMLKSILSICNKSDAADFNKKIHINRFDKVKVRDNKPQISEKIYEIIIGFPKEMEWCEEVNSYHGLHFCLMGKTAHIYVDEVHTNKESIIKLYNYKKCVDSDFKKLTTTSSSAGMTKRAIILWKSHSEGNERQNENDNDNYTDIPGFFAKIVKSIKAGFIDVFRKIGFYRQKDIMKIKYQTLIKDFYIHYLPLLIGE